MIQQIYWCLKCHLLEMLFGAFERFLLEYWSKTLSFSADNCSPLRKILAIRPLKTEHLALVLCVTIQPELLIIN